MRRQRLEPLGAEREVWNYDGRREFQGVDCYTWVRFLPIPDPVTGYTKMVIALPVSDFWPVTA